MSKENMHFRLKLEIGELVNEMINRLPEELFKSKNSTFLDPSMGGGQYVRAIEQKLRDYGHTDDNINCRVFGVEKSVWKVNFAINKHKLVGTYKVDTKDIPDIFMNMKFDCIVGNPPYQNSNENNQGSSAKLWMTFVEESVKALNSGGYLCIVHPIGWRTLGNKMWKDIYQKKQVIYARIEPEVSWSVGVKVDWYILKNSEYSTASEVDFSSEKKLIDFRTVDGIVNGSVIEKILNYTGDRMKFNQIHTFDSRRDFISENKSDSHIFPLRHTTPKNFRWSSKKHDWQNMKKVLVSNSGYLYPEYDDGMLGTTQACWAIFVSSEKEGKHVISILNSKLIKYFINGIKTSGYNNKLLNLIPYPKNLSPVFSDGDLYKYFKLTSDEIKTVEESIKD